MEEPERTGSIGEVMGALGTGRKTARCAHGKGTGRPRPPPDHDIVHQRGRSVSRPGRGLVTRTCGCGVFATGLRNCNLLHSGRLFANKINQKYYFIQR